MVCVLVTGGQGYLAQHIILQLTKEPWVDRIITYDIVPPPVNVDSDLTSKVPVKHLVGDIVNLENVAKACEGVDLVFHTCALIDLAPFPSDVITKVNVQGTQNVITACQNSKQIKWLIYTSSIDVTYNGVPIRNGDETLPYARYPRNGYIRTKTAAEQLVLSANNSREGLVTCALRPSHIWGPKDFMIPVVITKRKNGEVPVRIGQGKNAYVFVENCAAGHIQCARHLVEEEKAKISESTVAGEAFFISDCNIDMWDHMKPLLEAVDLTVPKYSIPIWTLQPIALIVEILCWIASWFGFHFAPLLNLYVIKSPGIDYYFNTSKAQNAFNFKPVVTREEAMDRTITWVKETFGTSSYPG